MRVTRSTPPRTEWPFSPVGARKNSFEGIQLTSSFGNNHVSADVLTAALAALQRQQGRTAAERWNRLLQQYRGRQLAVVSPQQRMEPIQWHPESISLRQAPMPDLLVTRPDKRATVTIIEDPVLLESVGGVGVFLRWR
jgi:hypothetical protein